MWISLIEITAVKFQICCNLVAAISMLNLRFILTVQKILCKEDHLFILKILKRGPKTRYLLVYSINVNIILKRNPKSGIAYVCFCFNFYFSILQKFRIGASMKVRYLIRQFGPLKQHTSLSSTCFNFVSSFDIAPLGCHFFQSSAAYCLKIHVFIHQTIFINISCFCVYCVINISYVSVVTPADHPKPIRNRCAK